MRVRSNVAHHKHVKRVLKRAKGFRGGRSKLYRTAKESVDRAERFATRDRRAKKRDFRKLWIIRINAAARENGLTYGEMMNGLKKAGVEMNRKMLSEVAIHDSAAFTALAQSAKNALSQEKK